MTEIKRLILFQMPEKAQFFHLHGLNKICMDKVVNILLVEDDHLDIIDMKRTLDKMHILNNMMVAKNGEDALQILSDKAKSTESNSRHCTHRH